MSDSLSRVLRTLLQLIAGGAFTALFNQITQDADPALAPYLVILFSLLVSIAQNVVESQTGKKLLAPTAV